MELYELEKIIASRAGINLPDRLGIDFNEPKTIMTVPEEISWNTWKLENNLTTKAKILQEQNKDLTIEQAQALVDENKEINGPKEQEQQTGSIFNRLRQRPTDSK